MLHNMHGISCNDLINNIYDMLIFYLKLRSWKTKWKLILGFLASFHAKLIISYLFRQKYNGEFR